MEWHRSDVRSGVMNGATATRVSPPKQICEELHEALVHIRYMIDRKRLAKHHYQIGP